MQRRNRGRETVNNFIAMRVPLIKLVATFDRPLWEAQWAGECVPAV